MADDRMPNVLTVEEAAKVLRIGRTAAYQLAQRFEATAGAEGLPVIRVGHLLRVPVPELERRLGGALRTAAPVPVAAIRSSDEVPTSPVPRPPIDGDPGASGDDDTPSNAAASEPTLAVVPTRERVAQDRRRTRNRPRSRDQLSLFVTEAPPLVDPPARDNSSLPTHRRTRP